VRGKKHPKIHQKRCKRPLERQFSFRCSSAPEYGAATALAALTSADRHVPYRDLPRRPAAPSRSYRPGPGETVCVVLCGANTDPSDLVSAGC
ncbi:hypothetical protein K353_06705, partial [Kitasatospora sp. SolWspMP-SS2h]